MINFILITPALSQNKEIGVLTHMKNSIRPYIEKIIGVELCYDLLGPGPNHIFLPKIPKVLKNAKSTKSFVVDDDESSFSKEELDQYNYNFIVEVIYVTKSLKANSDETSKWMNVMNQGASHEGLYRAVVLDNSYYGLEKMENPVNDSVIDFSLNYLKTYVGSILKKNALEKSNFYTLKRVSVEKSLDVMDILSQDKNKVLNWYAVFSSKMAREFPNAFSKKVRKMTNANHHKGWAKTVPYQLIKAEVIIKLHKIFNYLNQ